MRVILVRRRAASTPLGEPSVVHLCRVPDGDSTAEVLRAPCGAEIKPDEAEVLPRYTGIPCGRCAVLTALASDAPPVTRAELEGTQRTCRELEVAPADPVATGFSLSWRGRLVHRVAAGAPETELDGGTLVLGLCGALGWGPIRNRPRTWPVCEECTERTDEAIS